MKVVSAAQMQALDRRTIEEGRVPGLTLMSHAGAGVVGAMEELFGSPARRCVTILCGKGNNGGDGFVVARLLRRKRAQVQVLLMANPADLQGDANIMYHRFIETAPRSALQASPSRDELCRSLRKSDLIVDALLGTGLSTPVTGPYREAIEAINDIGQEADRPVTAIDLPSGIHADTGSVLGTAVRATLTVTCGLPKLGLYLGQGIDHAGLIRVADIGIPQSFVDALASPISLMTRENIRRVLPRRTPSAHKGTFGHAGVIAGSAGKTGAAAMAAKAALRVGSGLVTVATPAGVNSTLEAKLLEVMTSPMPETDTHTLASQALEPLLAFARDRTAVAIGPGLGVHPETAGLIRALIGNLEVPSVIDADGLNALAGQANLLRNCKIAPILTPHPGEMARLSELVGAQEVNADRIGVATRFAHDHRVIVVLKGARTVVAHPDGQVAICPTGNAGMATAGTGDVLTGMIVGFLAQRLSGWDAACAGTYLHGLAGDLAAARIGQAGMIAGDLLERIPEALAQLGG